MWRDPHRIVASAAGATTKGADKKDLDASRIYENLIGQEAGKLGGKVCRFGARSHH